MSGEARETEFITSAPAHRSRAISSRVAESCRSGCTTPAALSALVRPLSTPDRLRKKCESYSPIRTSNWPECLDENPAGLEEQSQGIEKASSPSRVPLTPPISLDRYLSAVLQRPCR